MSGAWGLGPRRGRGRAMASIEGPTARRESRTARRLDTSRMFQQALQVNPPPPAGPARLTEPLVWHDQLPNELMPLVDQSLVTESFECWLGWWYWHLDYYSEAGCKIRYVADIQYCWNPGGMVPTMPWLHEETTIKVKAARNRGACRSVLMLVENGNPRQNWAENVLWRLEIVGCYLLGHVQDPADEPCG